MKKLKKWFKELLWQRCHFCGEKRQYFYYLWDLPDKLYINVQHEKVYEMCTHCVSIKMKEYENMV